MTLKKLSLIIACLAIVLIGCPDPAGSGNNGNNDKAQKLTVGYLSNLMVDIGDAAALGISKRPVQRAGNRSVRAVTDVEEIVEKNYLVKITTDISHGNVEWDESGLTNVTFRKKTTIDTMVWIPVFDEKGNPVYITDEVGNLILDENEKPIQEMELMLEDQTITQDEIPAQVNRLYVYNTYTYIQFVPDDTATIPDTRPDDLGKPDNAGYYDYDKRDYYNDDFHQSFVIENSTGNIYSLADAVYIENIHNGLLKVKDSPYIWDCRIKDNDELEIFSLFQNTTVDVIDYYKDKYGNNYIYNDGIDTIDFTTNTIFFIETVYHTALNNEVMYMRGNYDTSTRPESSTKVKSYFTGDKGYIPDSSWGISNPQIRLVGENCTYRAVTDADELYFNGYQGIDGNDLNAVGERRFISHLKDKQLYFYQINFLATPHYQFHVIDTDTAVVKYGLTFDNISGILSNSDNFYAVWPMSYDTAIFIIKNNSGNTGTVYYHKINYDTLDSDFSTHDYLKAYNNNLGFSYNNDSCVLLMENISEAHYKSVDYYNRGKWSVITINGRDEYTYVIREVNGERIPVAVKTSEYIAEEQQVITLKPINR